MDILAVDGDAGRLAETAVLLHRLFPKATVITQEDALMAGKYAFHNPVDILFAAWEMKRMNGLQMADFVRRRRPQAWVFLTACPEGYGDELTFVEEADGFLQEPLCEAELCRALIQAEQNRNEKSERIEPTAPITLERTNAQ